MCCNLNVYSYSFILILTSNWNSLDILQAFRNIEALKTKLCPVYIAVYKVSFHIETSIIMPCLDYQNNLFISIFCFWSIFEGMNLLVVFWNYLFWQVQTHSWKSLCQAHDIDKIWLDLVQMQCKQLCHSLVILVIFDIWN